MTSSFCTSIDGHAASAKPRGIVVALDGKSLEDSVTQAEVLGGHVWGFKINDLQLREGIHGIKKLKSHGPLFCDAKLHDIPNTVANQVRVLSEAGADIITLHASGGPHMLEAARRACDEVGSGTWLVAVTVLTSLDAEKLSFLTKLKIDVGELVSALAAVAFSAGMDGVVSAAAELPRIRDLEGGKDCLCVTPGLRWEEPGSPASPDDQARVATPLEAWRRGADLLVMGRSITEAPDPLARCKEIQKALQGIESIRNGAPSQSAGVAP